jgi:ABC-type multidrug transport system fused ATPase/permease subunit
VQSAGRAAHDLQLDDLGLRPEDFIGPTLSVFATLIAQGFLALRFISFASSLRFWYETRTKVMVFSIVGLLIVLMVAGWALMLTIVIVIPVRFISGLPCASLTISDSAMAASRPQSRQTVRSLLMDISTPLIEHTTFAHRLYTGLSTSISIILMVRLLPARAMSQLKNA